MKEDWRIEEREGKENFGNKDAMCQFSGKTSVNLVYRGVENLKPPPLNL
jgi:hypothetical protein